MKQLIHFIIKYTLVFAKKKYEHKKDVRNFALEITNNQK